MKNKYKILRVTAIIIGVFLVGSQVILVIGFGLGFFIGSILGYRIGNIEKNTARFLKVTLHTFTRVSNCQTHKEIKTFGVLRTPE